MTYQAKDIDSVSVAAVVVTFNRLELLKQTIEALRGQEKRLAKIVVVNNGSTDGTAAWLGEQTDLCIVTQENVGGSGGFYTGIQKVMEWGTDYVWCMDDDVFPTPACLKNLLETTGQHPDAAILAPRRYMEGRIVCHDFTKYNLTRPFSSMYQGRIARLEVTEPTYIVGTAFEGPLIRRDVIEKIGLPNRDLFIFCDDTDYCLRAHLAGFRLLYVPQARMEKKLFFSNDTWAERERKKKWKRFYQVRNSTYLNHHYGRNWGVRTLRGFIGVAGYIATALFTAPFSKGWQYADIPRLWHAYKDGLKEKLGKM